MSLFNRYVPKTSDGEGSVPFSSAEEAWFWFVQAHQARQEGARIVAGAGLCGRPCEPVDILSAVERLYRGRRLTMDHVLVLRHYGRRLMPPDLRRPKEVRAFGLWEEALRRLEDVLVQKGIVTKRPWYLIEGDSHHDRPTDAALHLGRVFG